MRIKFFFNNCTIYKFHIKTFTQKCELGGITDINVVTQEEASSVSKWDLSPGEDNTRVLLTG